MKIFDWPMRVWTALPHPLVCHCFMIWCSLLAIMM